MRKLKFLTTTLVLSIALISCSDDDDTNTTDEPTADYQTQVFASNNSNGNVTMYDTSDPNNVSTKTFLTLSTDAEGVYYDASTDQLTQASRTFLQLNSYADIGISNDGITLNIAASGSADLVSPRDIAVNGSVYVVSDNSDVDGDPTTADGRFFIYTKAGDQFTLRNTVTVNFAVWGIEFVGNNLYAVVDKTNEVALFTNFASENTTDATITATKRVAIEGIVRTHGLGFDDDTMILTDIGDAAVDSDGAFHIISDFETKFNAVANGETLVVANNQIRVAGSATFLGNPVSADFDSETNTVFIAERANGGGRVLTYTNADVGGNITPTVNSELSGASAVYAQVTEL